MPHRRDNGQSLTIWNFNIDCKRRNRLAPVHLDPHLVRIEGNVTADDGENLLAEETEQIGLAARAAFVREQNLQAFPRDRRGGPATEEIEELHAAFRPNSLLRKPWFVVGMTIGICSPLRRLAASK